MKGVILSAGMGTRLHPLTITTNKNLLPVYDKPLIEYPMKTLRDGGVDDILLVSNREHIDQFAKLFGSTVKYAIQENPKGGIADALKSAKGFVSKQESFVLILADNIFEKGLDFSLKKDKKGKIFLKQVDDAFRFGVPEFNEEKEIISIIEKPEGATVGFAQTGAYMYRGEVFNILDKIKPSARGELEISDVNNYYAKLKVLDYEVIEGFWRDAGTFEALLESSIWVSQQE